MIGSSETWKYENDMLTGYVRYNGLFYKVGSAYILVG